MLTTALTILTKFPNVILSILIDYTEICAYKNCQLMCERSVLCLCSKTRYCDACARFNSCHRCHKTVCMQNGEVRCGIALKHTLRCTACVSVCQCGKQMQIEGFVVGDQGRAARCRSCWKLVCMKCIKNSNNYSKPVCSNCEDDFNEEEGDSSEDNYGYNSDV